MFWPDDRGATSPPVGFGLFRAIEGGYELWLAGLDLGTRGGGHGRKLLAALFATAQGQKTWVLRVQRGSRYFIPLQHILADFGFKWIGDTTRLRWFMRKDAPADLASRIRDAVDARSALN